MKRAQQPAVQQEDKNVQQALQKLQQYQAEVFSIVFRHKAETQKYFDDKLEDLKKQIDAKTKQFTQEVTGRK